MMRLTHERHIHLLALAAGLPGSLVALILVWTGNFSSGAAWTLTFFIVIFWLGFALSLKHRVVFSLQTLSNLLAALREEDFATAAILMGASPARVIGRHLLPSFASHLIASATLSVPAMILGETALSFLGLGLRPPVTSWGVLLNEAQNINVVALYPWLMLSVVPVFIVVLAFNFFGDGLRDAADPYSSTGRT